MPNAIERAFEAALRNGCQIGQIVVRQGATGFSIFHREDESRSDLQLFHRAEDAIEIARHDDAGNYRPLKTAPNLRHGWRLEVVDLTEVRRTLDCFYPGRLAMFAAWQENRLTTTALRDTLDRQSGIYRVAAKISDAEIDEVVGNFCRSDGGCLRTILWKRDEQGTVPSTKLPPEKYDPQPATVATVPLLCQEACNLLVAECRKVVKAESAKEE